MVIKTLKTVEIIIKLDCIRSRNKKANKTN